MSEFATCAVCGKQYKACLSCKDQKRVRPWKSITDTIGCYKIFLAISKYENGYLTKDETRKQLGEIAFNKDSLKEPVQRKIDEIMDAGAAPERQKKQTKQNTKKDCE